MIEIVLGLLLIVGALAILAPGVIGIDLIPLIGYGGAGLLIGAGVLLIAAGLTRRAIRRDAARGQALRTARLTIGALLVTTGLAIGLPLAAEPLNLVRVAGFPLGYYLAAKGAVIGLVVLAFVWAARQNRIDAEEPRHE